MTDESATTTASFDQPPGVRQLRLIIHTEDFDRAFAFYHRALGLPTQPAFEGQGEARVAILRAGAATIELSNTAQVAMIDGVEAEGRPSDRLRIALEVDDTHRLVGELVAAGGNLEAEGRETPWRSINARLRDPDGLQLTLFQELATLEERADSPGFVRPVGPDESPSSLDG